MQEGTAHPFVQICTFSRRYVLVRTCQSTSWPISPYFTVLNQVALVVADAVEKIRVNPGNFADGRKTFEETVYETDEQYFEERNYIKETFVPLVLKCKEKNRAMRIGVNHGASLRCQYTLQY